MSYRLRRQALTGKLILQDDATGAWLDTDADFDHELDGEFAIVSADLLKTLTARVAQAEKRAAGQRKANAARKATVEPSE